MTDYTMSKYIDAERLKCELEKRLKNVRDYMNGAGMKYKGPKYYKAQGKGSAYDALLSVIDSLQQEQPEVDLDADIEMEWDSFNKHLAEYGNESEEVVWLNWNNFNDVARQFYELGLKARKEK